MKKPEEIKKGLGCYAKKEFCAGRSCAYYNAICDSDSLLYDAFSYIQQLEAQNAELKRERDAAIADMRNANICICLVCANFNGRNPAARKNLCKEFGELSDEGMRNILSCGGFKWRGPCEENTENP